MQIRPRREIDLTEFGTTGKIVLEPLNFSRKNEWRNNIGKATHYSSGNGRDMKVDSADIGDLLAYKAMAYMTEAPFKLNSLHAFSIFMDNLDAQEIGMSDRLMERLNKEIDSLSGDSPLQVSAESETSSSE